jgi:hypothetical protein
MEKLKVGRIYKLIDNTNGNIYIGSTTQILSYRLSKHKSDYRNYLNNKRHYITSFDIIKNDDYRIELIKYVIYKDKKELYQRERYYIENNECINKYIPTRTPKEYKKEYCELNKEYLKKYKTQYNQKYRFQCECGSLIRIDSKPRHFKTNIHINFINSK